MRAALPRVTRLCRPLTGATQFKYMALYFTFAITVISGIATMASRMALSLYALQLGAEPLIIGILAAAFSAFPMLLSVVAGKVADRYGARRPLTYGAFLAGAGMMVPYFSHSMPAVYAAALLTGLSFAFYLVAQQNLVGLLSTPENRAQSYANYSVMVSIANFAGPLFGGFSIDQSGYIATFLYIALISVLPVLMLIVWGGMLPGGSKQAARSTKMLDTLKDRSMWTLLATSSLVQSSLDMFGFYMPVYLHGLGFSASNIGVVLAMAAVSAVILRLTMARLLKWMSPEWLLVWSFLLVAVSFVAIPFSKSTELLMLLGFIFGAGLGACQPITMMMMFARSPKGRSGEAMGLRLTANHLTRVVAPLIFGFVASGLGLAAIFWINAALLGLGATLSKPPARRR